MYEFKMPSLGADMTEGTLVEWRVKPGEKVERGEVICEVETHKGIIEVEIWETGIVEELAIAPGELVPVGEVIARLKVGEGVVEEGVVEEGVVEEGEASEPAVVSREAVVRATPAARKLAVELGVDLAKVEGTGPQGAVTYIDVESAAVAKRPEHGRRVSPVARRMADVHGIDLESVEGHGPHEAVVKADVEALLRDETKKSVVVREGEQPAEEQRKQSLREAIAIAMAKSKREIPHYYLEETFEMSGAMRFLERYNGARPVAERLLPTVLWVRAIAEGVREVPEMNGFFVDGGFEVKDAVHVGVAISLRGGGVITPALLDVDRKGWSELMGDLRDLVARARRGKLRASEMMDGTITLTSLGELGVETVFGVIYPPQVAIVGVGKIVERPFAEGGLLGVRPVAKVTLAADHRVSDGIAGAKFLLAMKRYLASLEREEEA